VLLSNLTHIHKGKGLPLDVKGHFRPVRCISHLGKVVERSLLCPINPLDGDPAGWFYYGQYAGRKRHSAEALAFILQLLIDYTSPNPLFLVFVDISKAFDHTWRDGLYHKLLVKGADPRLLASIRALYAKVLTQITGGGLGPLECGRGVAQGSPNSTFFFTTFLNDLSSLLLCLSLNISLLTILITLILFLDDLVIPARSIDDIPRILKALEEFASAWKFAYNLSKCGVLPIRSCTPPRSWPFMGASVNTKIVETFLTNTFSSSGSWDAHVVKKLSAANKTFHALLSCGALGGDVAVSTSASTASAILWPSIDSGRCCLAAPRALVPAFQKFLLQVARAVLGVSARASHAGCLGELGWLDDASRGDCHLVRLVSQLSSAPTHSLSHHIMSLVLPSLSLNTPSPPLRHLFTLVSSSLPPGATLFGPGWKRRTVVDVRSKASAAWAAQVLSSPSLSPSYGPSPQLGLQHYLSLPPFPGVALLIKARINDFRLFGFPGYTRQFACPFCTRNATSPRLHFLIVCPSLAQLRAHHPLAFSPLHALRDDCQLPALLLATPPLNTNRAFILAVGLFLRDLKAASDAHAGARRER
jgi:hypothetical protein